MYDLGRVEKYFCLCQESYSGLRVRSSVTLFIEISPADNDDDDDDDDNDKCPDPVI